MQQEKRGITTFGIRLVLETTFSVLNIFPSAFRSLFIFENTKVIKDANPYGNNVVGKTVIRKMASLSILSLYLVYYQIKDISSLNFFYLIRL